MDEKKKKDEELQTRREFFKKAARKMLPMLGAELQEKGHCPHCGALNV